MKTHRRIKYALAAVIGIAILGIALFDNVHYAGVQSKILLSVAGAGILFISWRRLREAVKEDEPEENS